MKTFSGTDQYSIGVGTSSSGGIVNSSMWLLQSCAAAFLCLNPVDFHSPVATVTFVITDRGSVRINEVNIVFSCSVQ